MWDLNAAVVVCTRDLDSCDNETPMLPLKRGMWLSLVSEGSDGSMRNVQIGHNSNLNNIRVQYIIQIRVFRHLLCSHATVVVEPSRSSLIPVELINRKRTPDRVRSLRHGFVRIGLS